MTRQLVLAVIAAVSVTGCAALQAQDARATEQLLVQAGFQAKAADTPEKTAQLQRLTPGKIIRREQDGQASYIYVDPSVCKCVYAGTEQQYQEYRKLVRQRVIADETKVVTEESTDPYGWSIGDLWP
jgi:hypothetical protein